MKEFFIEFFELLANCVLVVCFVFVSFLLIINFFHYKEVSSSYSANISENGKFNNYKSILKKVDKKMNSVDLNSLSSGSNASIIYSEYKVCINKLKESTFNNTKDDTLINPKYLYDVNEEMLGDYNRYCMFTIPYSISRQENVNDFDKIFKNIEYRRTLVVDNAESVSKSILGNSAYSFSTDMFKNTIYNRTRLDFNITVNNYNMMVSILEDVADWYVLEYGGDN